MRLLIVRAGRLEDSETFIRSQARRLGPDTILLNDWPVRRWIGDTNNEIIVGNSVAHRAWRAIRSRLFSTKESYQGAVYARLIRRLKPDVVLAQYGPTGALLVDGCRRAGVPLFVHFHGYDASIHEVVARFTRAYHEVFREAEGVIGVSKTMCDRLLSMGAKPERLYWNACGVDLEGLVPARPDLAPPHFVFAGRFVDKKAPHLLIQAFARVHTQIPEARLTMIGDGKLLGVCRDLSTALGLDSAVTFTGMLPHHEALQTMRRARAYVQHSVTAHDGDMEGTPVAVMEAAGLGLPVISTRHAGIPDVIDHGRTGFLVEERDVKTMAAYMIDLARNPLLAGAMGAEARHDILAYHTNEVSVDRLRKILLGQGVPYVQEMRPVEPQPVGDGGMTANKARWIAATPVI